ncbi:DUF3072 domain-containing protein [Tautonia plasticadhaerens]|uniref:DUF3072 domain-containing protein n=1 Tax=Tautonia plasticadhaerens TaxID=2527974 RepID=A0A518H776_9BACT|nr:DUF3072 domain-containing protein [Tautonia plasticadhaerens]QDV36682.1 hypothetical protein ElP_46110 [Tautonia plasticadhaerens]
MATRKHTKESQGDAPEGNRVKDPGDWTTGEEPMTEAQRSYLHTLAEEAGEEVDDAMTKAEASEAIDELRRKSDRVSGGDAGPKGKS